MRKILMLIMLTLILGACSNIPSTEPISSETALQMIADGAVVLDIRPIEEFNKGHIQGAISFSANETNEFTPDRDSTLLVYGTDGTQTLPMIEDLKNHGYLRVYNLGGIHDWKYEIVWDATDVVYYNYYGGELPPDIITEINHTISHGTTTFTLHGIHTQSYNTTFNRDRYYLDHGYVNITSIDINGDGFTQQITDIETMTFYIEDYGFSINDWNFDGYPDISLWTYPGGSMGNRPTRYWLWDNEINQFVENNQLRDLSEFSFVSIDEDQKLIKTFTKNGNEGYDECYCAISGNQYIEVKNVITKFEDGLAHAYIYEYIDGEKVLVDDYYNGLVNDY